jgi:RNA polymerase sigma-70 factor (ECF subfamily)
MVHLKKHPKFSGVSDHGLLTLYITEKNQQAFETLVARYLGLINSLIPPYLNMIDREDMLIEIVAKIAANLETLNLIDFRFGAWVNRITKNKIVDFLRTVAHRNSSVTVRIDYALIYQSKSNPTDSETYFNELKQYVQEVLKDFESKDRLVVELFLFDQLKYREIAEKLAIPEGTLKSILFRTMKILRKKLIEKYPDCGYFF